MEELINSKSSISLIDMRRFEDVFWSDVKSIKIDDVLEWDDFEYICGHIWVDDIWYLQWYVFIDLKDLCDKINIWAMINLIISKDFKFRYKIVDGNYFILKDILNNLRSNIECLINHNKQYELTDDKMLDLLKSNKNIFENDKDKLFILLEVLRLTWKSQENWFKELVLGFEKNLDDGTYADELFDVLSNDSKVFIENNILELFNMEYDSDIISRIDFLKKYFLNSDFLEIVKKILIWKIWDNVDLSWVNFKSDNHGFIVFNLFQKQIFELLDKRKDIDMRLSNIKEFIKWNSINNKILTENFEFINKSRQSEIENVFKNISDFIESYDVSKINLYSIEYIFVFMNWIADNYRDDKSFYRHIMCKLIKVYFDKMNMLFANESYKFSIDVVSWFRDLEKDYNSIDFDKIWFSELESKFMLFISYNHKNFINNNNSKEKEKHLEFIKFLYWYTTIEIRKYMLKYDLIDWLDENDKIDIINNMTKDDIIDYINLGITISYDIIKELLSDDDRDIVLQMIYNMPEISDKNWNSIEWFDDELSNIIIKKWINDDELIYEFINSRFYKSLNTEDFEIIIKNCKKDVLSIICNWPMHEYYQNLIVKKMDDELIMILIKWESTLTDYIFIEISKNYDENVVMTLLDTYLTLGQDVLNALSNHKSDKIRERLQDYGN